LCYRFRYTPKMRNEPVNYATHATTACLRWNEGLLFTVDALRLAQFPVSLHTENTIQKMEENCQRSMKRKQTLEYRSQQHTLKQQAMQKDTRNELRHTDCFYKREPSGPCGCKEGKAGTNACKTKRCACRKGTNPCSASCGCVGCTNPWGAKEEAARQPATKKSRTD